MRYALQDRGPAPLRAVLTAWLLLATLATFVEGAEYRQAELLADAADGQLDDFTLLDASVIAGGARDAAEVEAARRRLESLWLEVDQPLIARLRREERPRAILSALHRLVLMGKYEAECTEVQRTLEAGDYNCVTATILYLELCRRHGLSGAAAAIPGHVYCRLQGSAGQDIQTTCKDWFESREGRSSSIASLSARPRELTDVQLLGKVYYNRGVSQLEAHDYLAAIDLLKTSLTLDPEDAPARNNLLAAHNNWALALCDAGDFAAAAEKLTWAREIDAEYGPLRTNDLYVHQKWVLHLCNRGRYSAAVELLEQGYERRPDAALFDGGRYALYGMWSRTLLESNRVREALAVLEQARRKYGDQEELLKQEVQAFAAGVERLSQQGDAAAAQAMLSTALARHPMAQPLRALAARD